MIGEFIPRHLVMLFHASIIAATMVCRQMLVGDRLRCQGRSLGIIRFIGRGFAQGFVDVRVMVCQEGLPVGFRFGLGFWGAKLGTLGVDRGFRLVDAAAVQLLRGQAEVGSLLELSGSKSARGGFRRGSSRLGSFPALALFLVVMPRGHVVFAEYFTLVRDVARPGGELVRSGAVLAGGVHPLNG